MAGWEGVKSQGIHGGKTMPSFWKRGTFAVMLAAGMAGWNANAQQLMPPCSQSQIPQGLPWQSAQPPGVWPWPVCPQTPPVKPKPPEITEPSQVPPPPEAKRTEPQPVPTPETPPETTPPIDTTFETAPTDMLSSTPDVALTTPQAGFGSPDVAFSSAPNMIGDLLRSYRSVTFSYLQAGDFAVANTSGAVTFRNSKVAENNSAVPRDRVSFRYNYFKNALKVQGLNFSPELGARISQTPTSPIHQFHQVQPGTKQYNVELFTFALEKTFLNKMASVEVRAPFARTLDSNLNLVSGVLLQDVPGTVPLVQPSPGGTLGNADLEMQDMNVILKAVLLRDPTRNWLLSSGMGVTIPTGADLKARVVDYSNDIPNDPGDLVNPNRNPLSNQFAYDQRTRNFIVRNQTWALSPYLALAAAPTYRSFVNAFAQVEVPLNSSDWSFRERDIDLEVLAQPSLTSTGNPVQFSNSASGKIRAQTLLHLDAGGGYWFYRNLQKTHGLTGLAGLMELHYTGTLQNADIVTVPETPIRTSVGGSLIGPLPPARLGNIANRVDILNYTVGGHVLLGRNIVLSTAFVTPLRKNFDRTFDGELNAQLNIYR